MDKQNYYDPEETETYSIKLSEASGEHPEESNGVFDRPAAYNARFRPKISVPGSQQQFPIIAGLRLKNVQRTPAVQRLWATRAGVCAYPTVRERFSRTELKGNTRTGVEIIVDETAQRNRRKCNNIDNTTSLTVNTGTTKRNVKTGCIDDYQQQESSEERVIIIVAFAVQPRAA